MICYNDGMFNFVYKDIDFQHKLDEAGYSSEVFEKHIHPFDEIVYFINGNVTYTVEAETHKLKPGDVIFIPNGSRYYVRVFGNGKKMDTYTVNLCFFDDQQNEVLLNDEIALIAHFQNNQPFVHLQRLSCAFHRASETLNVKICNFAKTKGEFFLLLDSIRDSASKNHSFYYPIKRGIDALMEEWNQNEKIEKYALLSEVSITYFYRCFRGWSGKSPVEYRNMLRLSNAESLLRNTDAKVQEVSQAVGFDDPFYFCRLFTSVYGISPKAFRKYYQETDN